MAVEVSPRNWRGVRLPKRCDSSTSVSGRNSAPARPSTYSVRDEGGCVAALPWIHKSNSTPPPQLQQHLEDDEDADEQLEQPHAPIAGHVQHQLQRLLHSLQLLRQRAIAVEQVEFCAQVVVDAVERDRKSVV